MPTPEASDTEDSRTTEEQNIVPPVLRQFRPVVGLSSATTWALSDSGREGRLLTRIAFLGPNNQLLLDSTLDWGDEIFLADGLLEIVDSEVQKVAAVKDVLKLDLDKDETANLIKRLESVGEKIPRIVEFLKSLEA